MTTDIDLPSEDRFGYWLAGLLDAEGHFRIDGQRHKCECQIRLRADNLETLALIQQQTGLGGLSIVVRHNQSNEAVWTVASKADCLQLCNHLARFPLRAKKRLDLNLWTGAVRHWCHNIQRGQTNDWTPIEMAAQAIKAQRKFTSNPIMPLEQDHGFWSWLGGFVDGEGSFGLHMQAGRPRPSFQLKVRADDRATLQMIQRRTGLGKLYQTARIANTSPRTSWTLANRTFVQAWSDLIFDGEMLLWGHKKHDFAIWWEAVQLWKQPHQDWNAIMKLRNELRAWQQGK